MPVLWIGRCNFTNKNEIIKTVLHFQLSKMLHIIVHDETSSVNINTCKFKRLSLNTANVRRSGNFSCLNWSQMYRYFGNKYIISFCTASRFSTKQWKWLNSDCSDDRALGVGRSVTGTIVYPALCTKYENQTHLIQIDTSYWLYIIF